ncbi:MAG: STAS-like domain-containing protein [bacterium]|nr:STAS-like domain-containing protein [bacterium]
MRIVVYDIIHGDRALTSELGVKVRDAIGEKWRNEKVILDFHGVRNVSSSFLSQANHANPAEY